MIKGIDLKKHRTTPLQALNLNEGDLLIAMEPWQVEFLKSEFGKEYKCTLLGLWSEVVTPYIGDPFGASAQYFINCFNYIENSVHEITSKISRA
jgi:protein-tyrosine-phosphatase